MAYGTVADQPFQYCEDPGGTMNDLLRKIPKVDDILKDEGWLGLAAYPVTLAKDSLREVLDVARGTP